MAKNRDEEPTGTQIDLGEDLLEKTRTQIAPPLQRELTPEKLRTTVEDELQSAKILHSEGLTEEAKKILRQIMIADPGSVAARAMLAEIHKQELKQIFQPTPQRKRFNEQPVPEFDLGSIDADALMRGLDSDLTLGIYAPDGGDAIGTWATVFRDQAQMDKYAASLEKHLRDASYEDRIDLGIGFLEMGLPELAAKQFAKVSRRVASQPELEEPALSTDQSQSKRLVQLRLISTCLLAQAQIQSGRPYEATVSIQPRIQDNEIAREDKVELLYLMAEAHERMNKPEQALSWYQQVLMIDPGYRDVQERMSRIQKRSLS